MRRPDFSSRRMRAPTELRFFKPLPEPSEAEKAILFVLCVALALIALALIAWGYLTWGAKP